MRLTILNVAYPLAPVTRDSAGGAEQIVYALDEALSGEGHNSLVIACEGSRTTGTLLKVPAEQGVFDEAAMERAALCHRKAIASALAFWHVDLVHLHGIDFHRYAPLHDPTLITLHLPLAWYPADVLQADIPGRWFHCVSQSQDCGRPANRHFLPPIANGIDVDAFCRRERAREFAFALGRVCPEKGLHLALDAARLADVPFFFGGPVFPYGAHCDYFEKEIRPRLDERRRFLGPVGFDRKRRLLAAARCVLVPSLAPETSSLVAMEALASGTPVIAFANGALADIIRHGETGFLVETVEEMAEAIAAAGRIDPEFCRAQARERFAHGRMVADYLALYRRLVEYRPLC